MNNKVITVEAEEIPIEQAVEKSFLSALEKHEINKKALEEKRDECLALKLNGQDKEAYTLIRETRLNQKTSRVVIEKICKKGREDATRTQKAWIAVEKDYVKIVSEGEDYLKKLEDEFDAEQERIKAEIKRKQEEAFIIRQAELTKMGAIYQDGNFVLNDVSYEAILIKESDDEVWETMNSKFNEQYLINEEKKIAEEKIKEEAAAAIEAQRLEQERKQKELEEREAAIKAKEQEEIERQQKQRKAEEAEKNRHQRELQTKRFDLLLPFNLYGDTVDMSTLWILAESHFNEILDAKKKLFEKTKSEKEEADRVENERKIKEAEEAAIIKERERAAEELRQEELKKQQDEEKKKKELEMADDKTKWNNWLTEFKKLSPIPAMKSPAYRTKASIAREKIEEISNI